MENSRDTAIQKKSKFNSDYKSKWSRDDLPQKPPNDQSLGDDKPHLSGRKPDEPSWDVEPRMTLNQEKNVEPRRDVEKWTQRRMWRQNPSGRSPLPRSMTLVKTFEKFFRISTTDWSRTYRRIWLKSTTLMALVKNFENRKNFWNSANDWNPLQMTSNNEWKWSQGVESARKKFRSFLQGLRKFLGITWKTTTIHCTTTTIKTELKPETQDDLQHPGMAAVTPRFCNSYAPIDDPRGILYIPQCRVWSVSIIPSLMSLLAQSQVNWKLHYMHGVSGPLNIPTQRWNKLEKPFLLLVEAHHPLTQRVCCKLQNSHNHLVPLQRIKDALYEISLTEISSGHPIPENRKASSVFCLSSIVWLLTT